MAETSTSISTRRAVSTDVTLGDAIGPVDAFSTGMGIVLAALRNDARSPALCPLPAAKADTSAMRHLRLRRESAQLRAHFEAAAARFDNSITSTVLCIGPVRRPAVA